MNPEEVDALPSRPFKGFDWSLHYNVQRLVVALFGEYEAWYRGRNPDGRLRDPQKVKRHLTHFALEAYRTHRALPGMSMGVHLGNDYYNREGDRYHPSHLSYRIVINVTVFLVAAGYLERLSEGQWHPDPAMRRTTRFRATDRLIALCEEKSVNPYMITRYGGPEVIVLRTKRKPKQKQGDLIDYKDTPFTKRARDNLKRVNDFIAGHHINLDITDEQEEELLERLRKRDESAMDKFLDFTKTHLVRIFNNSSFEEGGRFYGGWWQQIPGDYRYFITIDGKRTVQLDYSGMHFAIMYADIAMDMPMADPYTLNEYGGHLRGDIKKAFNIVVNCANRKQAIETIKNRIQKGELSEELVGGEKLIEAFIDTHPLIKDKIASGEGIRGQFVDSQVAEKVLLKGIDIGLCILPIHDGFITTAGDAIVLETLMNEAFNEVTGHSANVKPETFDLSVLPDAGSNTPYWIKRPDGTEERDGPIEGKATSFSQVVSKNALWKSIEEEPEKKKNKISRDEEWELVHGKQ